MTAARSDLCRRRQARTRQRGLGEDRRLRRDLARKPLGPARRQFRRHFARRRSRGRCPALERALRDLAPTGPRSTIERGARDEAGAAGAPDHARHSRQRAAGHRARRHPGAERARRQYRGIRERSRKRRLHRRRDVSRPRPAERARGPCARRPAQGARAARRRDHGRSDRRRGDRAPDGRAASAPCVAFPALP